MRALRPNEQIAVALISAMLALSGCGGGGGDDGGATVSSLPPPVSGPPPAPPPAPDPDPDPDPQPPPEPAHKYLFTPVSEQEWDETAVRKVLHTFAFGGQTTDAQIAVWADMAPEYAIEEILNFDEHNLRLSTPAFGDTDGLANRPATLRALAAFWSSDDPANGVPPERRSLYDIDQANGWILPKLWQLAATSRGLNPFRQKIGLWETNYHVAVNLGSGVASRPLLTYYDDIMEALERGEPYQDVMEVAASSAAIALQYGHRSNRFRNGVCDCNEDFAREYHQLFFGILGSADPGYHETVTIKNTAKALTDMAVSFDDTGATDYVDFGTLYHPDEPLEILGTMIDGTTAAERIAAMVEVSINHPESLDNLPVMIVRDLADDNLDTRKITAIRTAWQSMYEKNLLTFLRGYAISTIFHETSRIKFLTSIDRHLLVSNLLALNNNENYLDLYSPLHLEEDVQVFIPTHNVFGSQKGVEAASSDLVFRNNFNLVTERYWRQRASEGNRYGQDWEKDWAAVVPRDAAGHFLVKDVAEWLWQRFIADGLKNFGPLERAHVYSLLGGRSDLAYLLDETNPDRVITTDDVLLDPALILLLEDLANRTLPLNSVVDADRLQANRSVGLAINFIIGTPYIFVQEGT